MKKIILFLGFLLIPVSVYPFSTSVDVCVTINGYPPPDPAVVNAVEKAKSTTINNDTWKIDLVRSNASAVVSVETKNATKIITINYD